MLATMTTKGQITIPKAIRDSLQLKPNDRVEFALEGTQVVLTPVKTLKDLRGAVPAKGSFDLEQERKAARKAVSKRSGLR